jgi:Uma2 family endonuclease
MSATHAATTMVSDNVISLEIGAWGLDRFLELIPDRARPLIKYHHGRLLLVSRSRTHNRIAYRLDGVIKTIGEVLDIAFLATASTLFRKPGHDHGIEPDKSYYIEHAGDVRGLRDDIDLAIHPAPDLVIEVVLSHGGDSALAICREMGVPEVWVYWVGRATLEFLRLNEQGQYAPAATSRAFPFLTPADVSRWVIDATDEPDNRWCQRLRDWVRDELGRRLEKHDGGQCPPYED